MMLGEMSTLWIEDQRITAVAVGFGKRSVDGDRLARIFEGTFTFFDHYGDMAVDNHPGSRIDPKLCQHLLSEFWRMDKRKVGVLLFLVRRLIGNKVGLESSHPVLAKHGR